MSSEVSSRYAEALYELAIKESKLEKWLEEIEDLLPFLDKKSRLYEVCISPQLDYTVKKELLESCLKGKIDTPLFHFLLLVLKKKRFKYLSEIFAEYKNLVDQKLGNLTVGLTTAKPMEPDAEKSLQTALENRFKKKIQFNKEEDPSLIAGAILMIDSKRLDSSLRGRLTGLKNHLLRGIAI